MIAEPLYSFASSDSNRGCYMLCPDVILMPVDDGTARLVNLDGSAFHLSPTAAEMLNGVLQDGEEQTARRIANEHSTDIAAVESDLTALLAALRAKSLIRPRGEGVAGLRLRAVIALTISYPALKFAGYVGSKRLAAFALLSIARLCFALTGWARTIDAFQKCLGARQNHHLTSPANIAGEEHTRVSGIERESSIKKIENTILAAAARLPSITCKERALCCWFMLHSAGIPAKLVMGVRLSPFSGHCWCDVNGHILMDTRENCQAYTTLVSYE